MAYDYGAYGAAATPPSPDEMEYPFGLSLEEWARDKPLSILQLDPADRAVLRIADERDATQKKTFTKWVNKHLRDKAFRSRRCRYPRTGWEVANYIHIFAVRRFPRTASTASALRSGNAAQI